MRIKIYEVRKDHGASNAYESVHHYTDVKDAIRRIHDDKGVRIPELSVHEVLINWEQDSELSKKIACSLLNKQGYVFSVSRVL